MYQGPDSGREALVVRVENILMMDVNYVGIRGKALRKLYKSAEPIEESIEWLKQILCTRDADRDLWLVSGAGYSKEAHRGMLQFLSKNSVPSTRIEVVDGSKERAALYERLVKQYGNVVLIESDLSVLEKAPNDSVKKIFIGEAHKTHSNKALVVNSLAEVKL